MMTFDEALPTVRRAVPADAEPLAALADVGCSWEVRSVSKPQRKIPAIRCDLDLYGVEDVSQSCSARLHLRAAERTVLIKLVLENVRIDRSDRHSQTCRVIANSRDIG